MRILFLAHRVPYPPNKGEKLRAFWQLRELARNHTVDLFCFYDDPQDHHYAHELSQYCDRFYLEKLSFVRSRAQALAASIAGRPFTEAFFYSQRMREQVQLALRSRCYDRIFVSSSSMAQYALVTSTPKILDLVDVDSDKWQQYARQSTWLSSWLWQREARMLGAYEAALVRDFSRTVLCTGAEARLLSAKAPSDRIAVLENFLNVDAYQPSAAPIPDFIREWQPYLIFSGSMDYRPNIDAVTHFYKETFPLVRRDISDIRLVIAGRNPHRSILALKNDKAVKVTGSVPDMRPYLWGAAAAVVPMRIARGVQNKILEALAAGIPVVSSTVAAAALAPEVHSLLLVADSPQQMSASVVRLLREGPFISSQEQRIALKRYIERLNLPLQLERLVRNPEEVAARDESHASQPEWAASSGHVTANIRNRELTNSSLLESR